jgi:hypothetical protein
MVEGMWIKKLFVWSLVFKMTLCVAMLVLLMVYYFHIAASYEMVPRYWILILLLIPGMAVSFIIRRQVLKDRIKKWSLWLFGIESIFTIWVSFAYFSSPMHDIALDYFGHHGRFGSVSLNGSSSYLINDVTLPFILFGPSFLIGIVYFIRRAFKK